MSQIPLLSIIYIYRTESLEFWRDIKTLVLNFTFQSTFVIIYEMAFAAGFLCYLICLSFLSYLFKFTTTSAKMISVIVNGNANG